MFEFIPRLIHEEDLPTLITKEVISIFLQVPQHALKQKAPKNRTQQVL